MIDDSYELMMFYNTENFFSPDPKPNHRLDPTNSGLKNWDERKYINKLNKIAHVFQLIKEEKSILPFIITLSEIENDRVLKDLITQDVFEKKYSFVHYESLDERGVDVALLYDHNKIEVIHSEPITYFFEVDAGNQDYYDTTRDVLFCKLKYNDTLFNLYVLHLPSKRDKDINKPKRDYIINDLKEKIGRNVFIENQPVILCGDFNENPNEKNLETLLNDEKSEILLNNPFLDLFNQKKFSTFYLKEGLLFDQILLSNHFFYQNFALAYSEAEVFNNDKISNWDKKFLGRPFRTYSGTRYLGGYSDHFPILVSFKKKLKVYKYEKCYKCSLSTR